MARYDIQRFGERVISPIFLFVITILFIYREKPSLDIPFFSFVISFFSLVVFYTYTYPFFYPEVDDYMKPGTITEILILGIILWSVAVSFMWIYTKTLYSTTIIIPIIFIVLLIFELRNKGNKYKK